MDEAIEFGNVALGDTNAGYIIGDRFEELTQLPGVFTIKQFFKALFENELPKYRSWVVGQGIDASIRYILYLCEQYSSAMRFQFSSSEPGDVCTVLPGAWEWQSLHFTEATRLEAELRLLDGSTRSLFTQDFIFTAARELVERGCALAVPESLLVTKQAQFQSFLRIFPLPIRVEAQFHLMNDNKRTLKSIVRFYQDYQCAAEVVLHFDLYTKEEADPFIYDISKKTFESFSRRVSEG